MKRIDRRAAIRAAMASALLPTLLSGKIAAAAGARIMPPTRPMEFVRRLRREMSGGFAVVVERRFEIRFVELTAGYRIDGRQISSAVDAPPNLEALARLERERRETGMFPLDLDRNGIIRSGPAIVETPNLQQAVDTALGQLSAGLENPSEIAEVRTFMIGLQQAEGTLSSAMPADLFVPPLSAQRASREIDLPGGMTGSLSSEYSGNISPETGLLSEARRVILTETGDTRRETVESWSLR